MDLNLVYPFEFWVAAVLLALLVAEGVAKWQQSWAKPALIVYVTIGVWYLGDFVYTGLADLTAQFPDDVLGLALWQVSLFLLAYRLLVAIITPRFIKGLPSRATLPTIDPRVVTLFMRTNCALWLVLFIVGLARADWQVAAIVWPPTVGEKVSMFSRPGIGSGADFLVSAAGYLYIMLCAIFGALAVLGQGATRYWALSMVAFTWPYFWFDRVRNTMLALLLPAVLSYWLFNRTSWVIKLTVLALLASFVNLWFLGVMKYRENYESTADIMKFNKDEEVSHFGLDMYKELCWLDYFVEHDLFTPNMGRGYYDEIVNVVPRTFWHDKPMIGIDYAIARGFGGNVDEGTGVYATISTGMIGQGVYNFGLFFGVISSSFLMALWTGLLVRLWHQSDRLPRLILFVTGCGLTFNMGRDITLLVLWPFVFGYLCVLLWERYILPRLIARRELEATPVMLIPASPIPRFPQTVPPDSLGPRRRRNPS